MKILLIYPYFLSERIHKEDVAVVPIGLYYVGALLKHHGYHVEILSWHEKDTVAEVVERTFREKNADLIGFSVLQANRWGAIEIARLAKKCNPRTKVVFGGVSPSFLWKHFLEHFPEVDFAVIGEGEYPFLNLVKWMEKGGSEDDLTAIAGIAYRSGTGIRMNNPAPPIRNLDDLPDPARYFTFQHVSSSRGCPWQCVFCGSPAFWGRKVRFHSVRYFVSQIERLYQKGISFFYVSDDTFTMNRDRVMDICKAIIEKGLRVTWAAICRVSDVDEEVLCWMRKAGCVQVSYGVESGSERIRRLLNKEISTSRIRKAFSVTRRVGILPRAYFIYGSPGETGETIQETIDLIRELKPLSAIFYILDIFPGTALYESYRKTTGAGDDIWLKCIEDIMYFETDSTLTGEQVMGFGEKLRRVFYQSLPEFAENIELADRDDLRPFHADFCSRLAMTFTHGDYAHVEGIQGQDRIAERLYRKALTYHPDLRAYLGLGILQQKRREYGKSADILAEGLRHFPRSERLKLCLGISYMNMGLFREARSHLEKCRHIPEAERFVMECNRALGQSADP